VSSWTPTARNPSARRARSALVSASANAACAVSEWLVVDALNGTTALRQLVDDVFFQPFSAP